MDLSKLKNGAAKIINYCLQVKKDEELVIVADDTNFEVGQALAEEGLACAAKVALIFYRQGEVHAEDPPNPIISAMCEADCVVLATKYSLSNSNARRKANKCNARIISIPGCNNELLISGAIEENFIAQKPLIERLGEVITHAQKMQIETDIGTNIEVKLCGRKTVNQTGLAHKPGSWSPAPNLETAVGPCQEGVNGVMMVDGVLIPGGIPEEPVKVQIKDGKIVKIEGGRTANKFEEYLASFNNENMYQIVEIGIGLNRKAKISGNAMAEDESQFGTLHLGIGEGETFGLKNKAPSHLDLVIRNPKIKIDNEIYFENEKLLKEI